MPAKTTHEAINEAMRHAQSGRMVTVTRNGATWSGRIVGYVEEPAMILEREDGRRATIVFDGAEIMEAPDAS